MLKENLKILILKWKINLKHLKEYSKKDNVNWGFVRDYDKNEQLYFCNTEYTEEIENENWVLINEVFK